MSVKRKIYKSICVLMGLILLLPAFFCVKVRASEGDVANKEDAGNKEGAGNEDELAFLHEKGVRIGASTGSIQEKMVREMFPDAEVAYIDKILGYTEVQQGKLDAFVYDKMQMELAIRHGLKGVRVLDTPLGDPARIAFGISKVSPIPDLESQVNQFIKEMRESGELEELKHKWEETEDLSMPQINEPENPRYHLRVATTGDVEPYSFYENGVLVGYDVELSLRLAEWMGAEVEFVPYTWDAIIPALQSGKVDIIASNLQVTAERAEEITYSEVLYEMPNGVMVPDKDAHDLTSFFDGIKESFNKTFIREERYKLFLEGIYTTVYITLLSILFGTVFGFVTYMLCRHGNRIAVGLSSVLIRIVQGLPVVVLLLILYYIIFAKSRVSGSMVAVFAFTLVFGSGVFGMLKIGVGAIDKGQMEAALSLGYGDTHSFFRIILPQAIPHVLPAYMGEVVALLKATAIVGYIAVQDLTKMGDIVRGRTYEAFFPLIAVALIYFALGYLMTGVVKWLDKRTDPKRRKKEDILKGVRGDD